uniref:Uncharacterized protein n=1 Tax=Moumouvirus sp. 'Monve' TaxID=1128131 RepID=H2ECY8_9VIRU|nr:hypothetical protein mv_R56 [Moumouvirus Monve]
MNDDKIIFQLIDSNVNVQLDKQFSGSDVKDVVHKFYEYIYNTLKNEKLLPVINITIKNIQNNKLYYFDIENY